MFKLKTISLLALVGILAFTSCKKEEDDMDTTKNLLLNITGLSDLGKDYAYENWIMVDGAPVSAGIFNVDASGNLSKTSFPIEIADLDKATAFILTIEPSPDNDPNPSSVHILAGDFSANSAPLSVNHNAALGDDFTTSTGSYILATPTDGASNNENSGIWWLNPTNGPGAGLSLPTLPNGWEYEGWVVIDGTPVTTGKFTSVSAADDADPFSSTVASGPAFPGEDLLMNAPTGLVFPLDLAGKTAVISIEPNPDNSPNPFLLKPLVGSIPATAVDHTLYTMDNNANATNPTGTATK